MHLTEIDTLAKLCQRDWKRRFNNLILSGDPIAAFLKTRIGTFYDKEILKYPTGLEATRNVVIDSTQVAVDSSSGRYVLQAGTLLINNTGAAGTNAVQTLNIQDDATSGALQLVVPTAGEPQFASGGGQITVPIPYNATAQQVQDALTGLPDIGAGNVAVTGPVHTAPKQIYTITFQGALAGAPVPLMQIVGNTINGTQANQSIVLTTPGVGADATGKVMPAPSSGVTAGQVVGILTHTVEFFYPVEPNVTDEPAAVYFHQCVFDSTKLINVSGNLAAVQAALPTCLFQ